MEQRIKTIRKSNNLTQTEFGKRIGVKGNTVTNYETGLRIPSEAVILAICREFDVSERWLRTGEGVMLVERSADEKLAESNACRIEHVIDDEIFELLKKHLNKS